MRIELLFGFLGSGKTTLARRILDEWGGREKLALIVNEFGDVSVDGTILQGNGIELIELSSGCVCCTLRGSLLNAIDELATDRSLDHIVIEATGLAEPELMIETLRDPSFTKYYRLGPITTVVDVARFSKIRTMLGPFYEEQIAQADILVLNKIDLADSMTLKTATDEIRDLNEVALIRYADHADIEISEIMQGLPSALIADAASNGAGEGHERRANDPHHGSSNEPDHGHDHSQHHAPAESFVIDLPASITRQKLEGFFENAPESLWRSKGYVLIDDRPALVQFSTSGLDITSSPQRERYYLVFIGDGLDCDRLSAELRHLSKDGAKI